MESKDNAMRPRIIQRDYADSPAYVKARAPLPVLREVREPPTVCPKCGAGRPRQGDDLLGLRPRAVRWRPLRPGVYEASCWNCGWEEELRLIAGEQSGKSGSSRGSRRRKQQHDHPRTRLMSRSLATLGVALWLLVRVTWYGPTGFPMYSGDMPYEGAAACSWNLPLGTQIRLPDGAVVTCLDRGYLGPNHVDLFAPTAAQGWSLIRRYGDWAWVEV